MVIKYKGETKKNLRKNTEYIVNVELPGKGQYVYGLHFVYNCKLDEDVDFWMYYSSLISLKQYFDFDEKELNSQAD